MKKLLIASHHFNCQGVQSNKEAATSRFDSATVPVIVNAFRDGMTEVLCPSLTRYGICGGETDQHRQTICPYFKTPQVQETKAPDEELLSKTLEELNLNTHLRGRLREKDIETVGQLLVLDFSEVLNLRGVGGMGIRSLLNALKLLNLKMSTKKTLSELEHRFDKEWGHLVHDSIEFVSEAGDVSSSS